MRNPVLTLVAALLLSVSSAQSDFPDLAPGHWAEGAVVRMADLGVVVGFPDGTFRGDDRLSRYEAALLIDRLLDVVDFPLGTLDAALAGMSARAHDLEARLDLLEGRPAAAPAPALRDRIEELEGEVARLRAELGLPPRDGAPGEAGVAGGAGAPGAAGSAAEAATPGALGDVGAPGAGGVGADAVGPDGEPLAGADDPFLAERRPLFLAATIGVAPDGAPLRIAAGHDELLGAAGLRASLDVLLDESGLGDAAMAVHVTHRFGRARWSGYVGGGLGYRYDPGPSATEGVFVGALLGGEYAIDERWGLVFEGTVDYHLAFVGDAAVEGSPARPALAVGVSFRF